MSTRKSKKTQKGNTRKSVTSIESLEKYINHFDWILIPNTRENKALKSPTEIENNDMFIYFLKRFLMQPYVRKYFIHKYRPTIDYSLIKFDFKDSHFSQKVAYIDKKIKNKKDFIIDIAQQLKEGGGGHWTSLKRENGKLEYMDSDPFYYGHGLNTFHKLVKNIPNPIEIYGDTNKIKSSQYLAKKSIQNLHKNDTFCQSWSLFFLTISNIYPTLKERIKFQEKNPVLHEDIEGQLRNFPDFFDNFILLLDYWITMMREDEGINTLIQDTQWENWTSIKIVEKLEYVKRDFLEKEMNMKTDIELQNNLFCMNKDTISKYIVRRKI
jgi:hypothetical protein